MTRKSRMEPLPEFINGFKVVEDLGMLASSTGMSFSRFCRYICKKCGKLAQARVSDLKSMKSCFCNRDIPGVSLRLRNILKDMKKRCYNKNSIAYDRYHGKNIAICNEWLGETNIFYRWALENGYKENLTLDRIDNSKGYSPDNCRWATYHEQMQNSSKAKLTANDVIEIRSIYPSMTYSQLASMFNVTKSTIAYIITRKTWANI